MGVAMNEPLICKKCNGEWFKIAYQPAKKAIKLLDINEQLAGRVYRWSWFLRKATPERIVATCSACGFQENMRPGTIRLVPRSAGKTV